MSTLIVEIVKIDKIEEHPNADRLDIVKIKGWEVCVRKGMYKEGDAVIYVPPDTLVPKELAENCGVSNYLGKLGANHKWGETHLRVKATKIRQRPSYGFLISLDMLQEEVNELGPLYQISYGEEKGKQFYLVDDLIELLNIKQYEPPVKHSKGDSVKPLFTFPKYTDIENINNFPDVFEKGEEIIITEKIHGMNWRGGYVDVGDDNFSINIANIFDLKEFLEIKSGESSFEFVTGSHNVRRRATLNCIYWKPFFDKELIKLIINLADEDDVKSVVLYGEIYGPGIQDMQYGVQQGSFGFRLFDISVGGIYLNYDEFVDVCETFDVAVVPFLYRGPFHHETIREYTEGPTIVCEEKEAGKFKGREGIVIRPVEERVDREIGRVILKSVGADYLGRKGGEDN